MTRQLSGGAPMTRPLSGGAPMTRRPTRTQSGGIVVSGCGRVWVSLYLLQFKFVRIGTSAGEDPWPSSFIQILKASF